MAKRRGRVPRPASPGDWELRFARKSVADEWDKLCASDRAAAARAHDWLRTKPTERGPRNHPLKGELSEAELDGKRLPQWQHEVTGAGRIWFLIDETRRTIWLKALYLGHPKATE